MARFIDDLKRTHYCGALREGDVDRVVVLFGWVANRRDHGGLIFIDLRDREGIAQVVFDPAASADAFKLADSARGEWVIGIRGRVRDRGTMRNPKIPTGAIEVLAMEAVVFNKADTPPFEVADEIETNEDKRLEHRYVDLRRPKLQKGLRIRHTLNHAGRSYMAENGFIEVETPYLVKYTPGGARNFLVPARLHPGKFYALAESPQLFKQLLMVSGYDRYFQIVRCFRDEALRLDRQPEFTQMDVEMSFVNQDDIFKMIEGLIFRVWKEVLGLDLHAKYPSGTFPRLPYEESMRRFGNDKPDVRYGMEHTDLTDLVIEHDGGGIAMFADIAQRFRSGALRRDLPAEIVKCLVVPASSNLSRTEADKLEQVAKGMGAKGLARARIGENGEWTQSPLAKNVTPAFREAIAKATGAQVGDLILFQLGKTSVVHTVLSGLRTHLAKKIGLIPESGSGGKWELLWVVDPPLFDYDDESKTWVAAHHPFTRPHDSALEFLTSDPGKVNCHRYDLVLNGFEIGGGSIRLHDPEVQKRVFDVLGIKEEEARQKFGFLLDALRLGAPPHGGIAVGWDRVAMLLAETEAIRDVIAFPKTQKASDLMTGAPDRVAPEQLAELHVRAVLPEATATATPPRHDAPT